jgi:hypothetical protein
VDTHLCVLDTNQYKLIIGVDILRPLQGSLDLTNSRLHLVKDQSRFNLPLIDKLRAFKMPSVVWYLHALKAISHVQEIEVATAFSELQEEMSTGQEVIYEHEVDGAALEYVSSIGETTNLRHILHLTQLGNGDKEVEPADPSVIGSVSLALAERLFDAHTHAGA